MTSAKLKRGLEPTDFEGSDLRRTEWRDFDDYLGVNGYRIWICNANGHWFQRHEWRRRGKNETELDDWIYNGYFPHKGFDRHMIPVSELEAI